MRPFIRRNHHLRFYLTSSKVNLNCSTNEPRVPRYFYTSQLLRLSTIFQRCSRNILTPCISAIQLEYAFCGDISRVKWKGRKKKGGWGKKKEGNWTSRRLSRRSFTIFNAPRAASSRRPRPRIELSIPRSINVKQIETYQSFFFFFFF